MKSAFLLNRVPLALALGLLASGPVRGSNPFELPEAAPPQGAVDEAVVAHWRTLGIAAPPLCSDGVFVRRVFLDVIGTLPTAAESRAFIQDKAADKRGLLINRLLERDEFADYWANKWSDLLRIKAEFPINLWPNAAQAYHRWVRTAIRDNLPYDQFARELLTASGSNFRVGPANFFRAVQSREPAALARAAALTFMGVRAEKWPEQQLDAMAMCFRYIGYKSTGEWKEEIVFFDRAKFPPGGRAAAIFPDKTVAHLTVDKDPRIVFADWLIRPENPWFTRAIANRVWFWLLGRGIVHEPDDFRADNPPSNPALLDVLEKELIAARYDLKALFRLILNSHAYQASSLMGDANDASAASFAGYTMRRLDAEVLIDALNQITGTTEKYSSAIPEPFTFIPEKSRAIALPDGSITSAFLETFGRPARDTGLEAERSTAVTANQRLLMLNSSLVRRKIEAGPKLQPLLRARNRTTETIDTFYLTILSRYPTEEERSEVNAHFSARRTDPYGASVDLAWALINSTEFLHRH